MVGTVFSWIGTSGKAADLVFELPIVGALARRAGHTLACRGDAERLLCTGELAGVFPEGFKGVGKPFGQRYKLQRFGRGGFASLAMKTGVPLIPCSIVGSEEIYPKLADLTPLARLLGLPYFPVTPLFPHLGVLGAVPLPSKWYIEFGEPISTSGYGPDAADDPITVFEVTDQVRDTIQQTPVQAADPTSQSVCRLALFDPGRYRAAVGSGFLTPRWGDDRWRVPAAG